MPEKIALFQFLLTVLATWRVTHLLAKEDGPADAVFRLRTFLGEGFLGKLMDCFKCLSIWVAAPMAVYLTKKPIELMLSWLAISGAACLLERIGQESFTVQPIAYNQNQEVQYGLLRQETGNIEEHGKPNNTI